MGWRWVSAELLPALKKLLVDLHRRAVNHVKRTVYFSDISTWLIDPGVYRVVGGTVGGAISHGPRFWKLKGRTSKHPNDNYHARMFTEFQRRDWVYYLQLWSSCVMSPLFRWAQNFHCGFTDLFMRKCHIVWGTHKSFHVKINLGYIKSVMGCNKLHVN